MKVLTITDDDHVSLVAKYWGNTFWLTQENRSLSPECASKNVVVMNDIETQKVIDFLIKERNERIKRECTQGVVQALSIAER